MKKILCFALFAIVLSIGILAADTFTNPVANGADPFIFKDSDGTYYLYATNSNDYGFRTYSSKNLVEWTAEGYCLVEEDVYVDPSLDGGNLYDFWAPEVTKYNGKYYMIFSFKSEVGQRNRLSIAVADSPKGPFKSANNKYLFPYHSVLDAHFFLDDDGTMYLYFAGTGAIRLNEQASQSGSNIWGCEFDMVNFCVKTGTEQLLVKFDRQYEVSSACVEGPAMLKHDGKYYLTFSSGSWRATDYSVCYAVSDSPLSGFVRDGKGEILACTDQDYSDNKNPHLYGTAHHSFVEAPNGKDTLIIYHCHRNNGISWGENNDAASPRSTCIDHVWFEDGKLFAGSKENPGVPTATAQPLLDGTELTRKTYLTGSFEKIPTLPTIYASYYDGSDSNPGTREAPIKTINKGISMLNKGGTLVLLQSYNAKGHLDLSTSRGPIMITAENNSIVLSFEQISVNSSVYFDNIIFCPEYAKGMAVIECNFNNVVFGEGVSCLNSSIGEHAFPSIVGGRWQNTEGEYSGFKYEENMLSSTKSYTVAVLGGKWDHVEKGSLNVTTPIGTADGARLVRNGEELTGGTPTTPATPEVKKTEIKMTIDSLTATVNGTAKTLDAAPIIRNSRTMLPVRFVAENLGATVGWDDATKTVTVKSADTTIEIVIGATTAKVNGAEIALDSPAFIENSR
ncbi:MAG: family 43 glycosylhydrolase, partial [Clostridia bacterium]|nr:family 43 glycosylhydrolase [Clostridia bacterium]